jgi:hypothetical protein
MGIRGGRELIRKGPGRIEMVRFLTEQQVAQEFAIGLRQLLLMRMRGDGPRFIKTSGQLGRRGGRVRYAVEAVEAWIASLPAGGGHSSPRTAAER